MRASDAAARAPAMAKGFELGKGTLGRQCRREPLLSRAQPGKQPARKQQAITTFCWRGASGRPTLVRFRSLTAMSYPATLFSVKIASPRDVAMEASMACDVLREWNAAHALRDRKVLLPLTDSAPHICDMLVAFLHPSPGAPMATMEKEIEEHLAEKRSVFIYFSEARAAFGHAVEHADVEQCKSRYAGRAVVDSFSDEKEFRARFAQQIEATLQLLPSLVPTTPPDPLPDVEPPPPADEGAVSELARQLLFTACDDPEAYIGRLKDGATLKIQANGQQLVPAGRSWPPPSKWEAAFNEILHRSFIHDAGCHGRLFQISTEGFAYLKALGKTPVGYIAELGSV